MLAGQLEEVEELTTSSSPPPCTLPGLPRLVTPPVEEVEEVEDIIQQPGQGPVEVRSSAISSRPSQQPLTAHPGPASGVGGDLAGVAGAAEEEEEELVELTT